MVKLWEKCDVYSLSHACPVVVWYTSWLCGSVYREITSKFHVDLISTNLCIATQYIDLHKPLSSYRGGPSIRYLSVMAVMPSYLWQCISEVCLVLLDRRKHMFLIRIRVGKCYICQKWKCRLTCDHICHTSKVSLKRILWYSPTSSPSSVSSTSASFHV